ncbi:MAG: phosphoribosylamine--glycine ligase [Verrucomicrobia bacterium]|nr:MAG: phosphoribosylamine--glycine ligase [Verrucomicrobiota bacterium]
MKVIVVGKGGREHAIVTALVESDSASEVFCYPGSDAILEMAKSLSGEINDVESLVKSMVDEGIDLCVGGEESWLAMGLADKARQAGIPTWGPVQFSSQLEASKEFAKEFMVRHNIPTGGYDSAEDYESAKSAITSYPTVLKFDGLAAGKGVAICFNESEAESFLDEVFIQKRFGDGRILIEEYLEGPEVSVIAAVADGEYQIFTPARDYKRLSDGDKGLNTGGMGAVASRSLISGKLLDQIEDEVIRPSVEGLTKDNMDFRGFLYAGLMLTPDGPKLLEYNCRFGDPEAQAVLPLIKGDFAAYLMSAAKGNLMDGLIDFDKGWSICLVLASAGYPSSSRSGDVINGLDLVDGVRVYHAGTEKNNDGQYVTNGGRVLAVVGHGETRETALECSYTESEKISFDGNQRRSDIGRLHF